MAEAGSRNYVPYAAPGISNVARIAWNHVNVQMKHGLAGGLADIDSNVETVWLIVSLYLLADAVNPPKKLCLFVCGCVKPGSYVALGYQQRMARARGEGVPET